MCYISKVNCSFMTHVYTYVEECALPKPQYILPLSLLPSFSYFLSLAVCLSLSHFLSFILFFSLLLNDLAN